MSQTWTAKTFWIICMLICLCACKSPDPSPAEITEKNPAQPASPVLAAPPAQPAAPQYFFLRGSFMGGYIDNRWRSLCSTDEENDDGTDFFAKDILAQDRFYVFENHRYTGASDQIVWPLEDSGLGSFEEEGAAKKLSKYGKLYTPPDGNPGSEYVFSLPQNTGEELSDLKIPDYSFFTRFIVNNKIETECELVTNREILPFPRSLNEDVEATAEGRRALSQLFMENRMENTSINFTKCVKCDFDNDGAQEYLMFAEAPRSKLGYPLLCGGGQTDHLGVYSALLYQEDNGPVHILYSDLRPYSGEFKPDPNQSMELMGPDYATGVDLLTAADLNGDGIYEIGIKISEWEHGFYLIYARGAEGSYEIALRSNWGM